MMRDILLFIYEKDAALQSRRNCECFLVSRMSWFLMI